MKQIVPIPSDMKLAPTLAQRVNQLREFRGMSVKDLARESRFKSQRIEDIEGGLESWLSSSDRQLLAKALNVEPSLLQEVETRISAGHHAADNRQLAQATAEQISTAIINGARELECPDCGGTLRCSVQEGLDIEGRTVRMAKAFCMKCPYTLR